MNLLSPGEIKRLLAEHGVAPHKTYGQHFLTDANVLSNIVASSEIEPGDTVLEIGPGLGVLTRELAARAGHVVAFEVDKGFVRFLNETLEYDNVTLIHADFLRAELDIPELQAPFCVSANLPYNITAAAIMRVLKSGLAWRSMTLLVQLEAAERLRAKPNTKAYGALSVKVQLRAEAEIVMRVSPNCFFPPPKVESAVVLLTPKAPIPGVNLNEADALVTAAFAMRRKTLANNLSAFFGSREKAQSVIAAVGLSEHVRAEALAPEQFLALAEIIGQ